jgi:hypothetical protein
VIISDVRKIPKPHFFPLNFKVTVFTLKKYANCKESAGRMTHDSANNLYYNILSQSGIQ